ncbi:MAG TPA: bifunctional riboflavin kinase/FAD synthetase [Steroidobacteraceae bacterium]|nr:bifunctional riboflavin kinase/FAD synthetase [Steroidobacteraceae bacterium]
MQLIRGFHNAGAGPRGCALTVGTYDGIHLGHCALLERLAVHARERDVPALMLTFEPTPREYLRSADPPARLTSFRERWRRLSGGALSGMVVLRFGAATRALSGEDFAQLVARQLQPAVVVVGHDFRFGRDGAGTAAGLCAAGRRLGFEVEVVEPVALGGMRVSSSAIREALARRDLAGAARFLGRPYAMVGRVVRGRQLGRTLGYPTANVLLHRRRSPLAGIFAVRVRVHGAAGAVLPGVASLGTRPTVGGGEPWLETHLFDFEGDLYGREIEVEFVAHLREELHFASVDAMVAQIHRDAAEARRILALP